MGQFLSEKFGRGTQLWNSLSVSRSFDQCFREEAPFSPPLFDSLVLWIWYSEHENTFLGHTLPRDHSAPMCAYNVLFMGRIQYVIARHPSSPNPAYIFSAHLFSMSCFLIIAEWWGKEKGQGGGVSGGAKECNQVEPGHGSIHKPLLWRRSIQISGSYGPWWLRAWQEGQYNVSLFLWVPLWGDKAWDIILPVPSDPQTLCPDSGIKSSARVGEFPFFLQLHEQCTGNLEEDAVGVAGQLLLSDWLALLWICYFMCHIMHAGFERNQVMQECIKWKAVFCLAPRALPALLFNPLFMHECCYVGFWSFFSYPHKYIGGHLYFT